MRHGWQSLRVRLAVLGFLAIYVPVLVLLTVTLVTEDETVEVHDSGPTATGTGTGAEGSTAAGSDAGDEPGTAAGIGGSSGAGTDTPEGRSPWAIATAVALGPAAAATAWWWAGRAVRPIDRVRAVAEDIEDSDLGRRIGLGHGPAEVVALAASFDAMLDRLQRAADAQRRLVEETSHELRTPLSVLVANADVVLADPAPTPAAYRQGLERSRAAAARLQAAVDDLLHGARGRARTLDRRPADVASLAQEVVDEARVVAAARDIVLSRTGPTSAECAVDAPTVRRALANLVDNAIRYAPPGTEVRVAIAVGGPSDGGGRPGRGDDGGDGGEEGHAGAGMVAVTVTDHGPGIPAGEQGRVFERFWRGRPDTPGTGLGLPIARQVAQAHGGDLTLRSPGPSGDGAAFTFTVRRGP